MQKFQCRIAPSLGGGFEGTPKSCWGTKEYKNDKDPTVFFGIYGLPDFYTLWRHKGKKYILWAGSDIQHFLRGYYLDDEGKMKIHPIQLSAWIDTNCESFVENDTEQVALRSVGIRSKVVPSFLGNVKDYKICYNWSNKPKVYTSVSSNDFKLYGWDKIDNLAKENPTIEFHLYGNTVEWLSNHKNVVVHGKVSPKQMNKEIQQMQGALRLTQFDGFSEIIAKSLLWGQYPISIISYPHTLSTDNIGVIELKQKPNISGREWLLSKVNKYPWNTKS